MKFNDFYDGYYDVHNQLPAYLLKMAEDCLTKEEIEKNSISSVEDFERRRDRIKSRFIKSIGGLDLKKTPLNAKCTGVLRKQNYKIKKIIYESIPKFYVTANLYVPNNLEDKNPAILLACGHSKAAKAEPKYQSVAIDLANNGFVVLCVDPMGQGERLQYPDKKVYGSQMWGTREHSYIGLQCSLIGAGIAKYFIWDLIRSVDYLESLDYVDNNAIGMTGNSGGGTQTAYMMLCEPGLKAAAPSCYITSRKDYMLTGQAHDSEQNIFKAISSGINYDDFVTGIAPKPVRINSVLYDFFCIEGAKKSYERAKKIYSLYGEDNISLNTTATTHGYQKALRQGAVNLFLEHLKNESPDFIEPESVKIESEENLMCTEEGQVIKEFKDAVHIHDIVSNSFKRKDKDVSTKDQLASRVKNKMNFVGDLHKKPYINERIIYEGEEDSIKYEKIFFFSEPGICVSGIYMHSKKSSDKCTIYVPENGTDGIEENKDVIKTLLEKGDVFVFDPRGIGASKSRKINPRPYDEIYGTEYRLNSDATMLGTSLGEMRIYDILRACDYIKKRKPDVKINLGGEGTCLTYVLFASLFVENIGKVYEHNTIESLERIFNDKDYDYNCRYEIYNILNVTDFPTVRRFIDCEKI